MTGQQKKRALEFKIKIANNPQWAIRAVLAIYAYQTYEEQCIEETIHHNKVGFNATDAQILSSIARQVLGGCSLTIKQVDLLQSKMIKYAGQLVRIAESRGK